MSSKRKICLSENDAEILLYDEHKDFELVEDTFEDERRWSVMRRLVVEEKSTGDFFALYYEEPASELQEVEIFSKNDDGKVELTQVFPEKHTITAYA